MLFGQRGHFGNEGNCCAKMSLCVLGSEIQNEFGGHENAIRVTEGPSPICVTQRVCLLQQWV